MARLQDLRNAIDRHAQDAVVTNYEGLIGSVVLPDPNDRHVLAAAIVSRSDIIVTCNLRDFPASVLETYNIKVQHPDDFICQLLELDPHAVVDAVRKQQASLLNPPVRMPDLLALFERLGLTHTVTELHRLMAA